MNNNEKYRLHRQREVHLLQQIIILRGHWPLFLLFRFWFVSLFDVFGNLICRL